MQKNDYSTVELDGVTLKYTMFDGIPYFHYRDVICRFLGSQVGMTYQIQKLHLEDDGGYFLRHQYQRGDKVVYYVAIPVLFKIINSLTVCIDARKLIFKEFCEKTFDIECELKDDVTKYCKWCGKKIPISKNGRRRLLYCSKKCQTLMHKKLAHERWYAEKAKRKKTAICLFCGKKFEKRTPQQYCCCKECGNLWRAAQKKELRSRPKSAFYNPREVYPDIKEPVWSSAFNW